MQHGGGSQALEKFEQPRRLAQLDKRANQIIESYERTGTLPRDMSPELLSHVAERMFLGSITKPSRKKRRRRRKRRNLRFGTVNRVINQATRTLSDRDNIWSSENGSFTREDLKYCLYRFRWDFIVTVVAPSGVQRPTKSLELFHNAINSTSLFPSQQESTNDPPSWFPLSFTDADGSESIVILIALPPGALQPHLQTYANVRTLVERATATSFECQLTPNVHMVDDSKLDRLFQRLLMTPFQCVTRYIRKHHRLCKSK